MTASGMEVGIREGYERLDELLAGSLFRGVSQKTARGATRGSARVTPLACGDQYLMTTRPSILACFISSKTALMSPSSRVVTVGWIWPRE